MQGKTVGHVETDLGLFLFPPCRRRRQRQAHVHPASAYTQLRDRPAHRRGAGRAAARHRGADHRRGGPAGASCATRSSATCSSRSRSSRPTSCSRRSTASTRCRWCASARRCSRSAWSPTRSSRRRWSQQQLDRSVPLGELLVRMGIVSREDLQTALARKMGYPLVDLDAFPAEAEALRKLSYAVARAPAGDAAAAARRPAGRRDRRPVAPRRARRGRVHRRDEGRARAGAMAARSRPTLRSRLRADRRRGDSRDARIWPRRSTTT